MDGRPGKVSVGLDGSVILLSTPSFWEQAGIFIVFSLQPLERRNERRKKERKEKK